MIAEHELPVKNTKSFPLMLQLFCVFAILLVSLFSAINNVHAEEETLFSFIGSGISWDTDSAAMEETVLALGFKKSGNYSADEGKYQYYGGKIAKQNCKWLLVSYEDEKLVGIRFFMLKGTDHYNRIKRALNKAFGTGEAGSRVQVINGEEEDLQAIVWHTAETDVYLTAVQSSTLAKVKNGKAAFMVTIVPAGYQYSWDTHKTVISGEDTGFIEVDSIPLSITKTKLTINSSGTPQITLAFRNESDQTVTDITYCDECYDKEGRFIAPLGYYHYHHDTYSKKIKPGRLSNKITSVDDGVEGTQEMHIAIKSYVADGVTYGVKDQNLEWIIVTK